MDFGSFSVRAGYAGEDSPKVEFPSTLGKFPSALVRFPTELVDFHSTLSKANKFSLFSFISTSKVEQ